MLLLVVMHQISERNPSVNLNETRLSAVPFFADQLTAFEVTWHTPAAHVEDRGVSWPCRMTTC